jgi:F-type H+-transporting ATPase subunit gamma
MANEKEIRDKIKSIKGTQKITKAMEMVAASKMRRAQEKMAATRPFNDKIQEMIAHIANAQTAIHPLIEGRDTIKRVGYIVVGSDRGLCGGLNVNLFKKLAAHCETYHKTGVELDFACFGAKALDFLKHHHVIRENGWISTSFLYGILIW